MSGHCDFCGVWHSGSCCHPERAKGGTFVSEHYDTERLLSDILDTLTRIETLLQEQNVAMTEPDDEDDPADDGWRGRAP